MTSPTARTLARLRQSGYLAAVVETWIPRLNRRRDLWGFADVLAVRRGEPPLLVQVTTAGHVAHRLRKARGRPELAGWLRAGGQFQVWGWRRSVRRWQVRIIGVRVEDLEAVLLAGWPRKGRDRQRGLFD